MLGFEKSYTIISVTDMKSQILNASISKDDVFRHLYFILLHYECYDGRE